jgi:hypothetical protein
MPHPSRSRRPQGRRLLSAAALAAATITAAACGSSSILPTNTSTVTVTNTFSGTLTVNGAATYSFATATAGTITATLTTIGDGTPVVGLSLGAWDGTVCVVSGQGLFNDNASQGTVVTASATTSGSFCARIYDVGKLTAPVDFSIDIVHP